MRKFFLVLIAISIAAVANAQIYAGGSVSFSSNSNAESTTVSIAPEVGYDLNDKFSLGAVLGLYTYSADGGYSTNVLSIRPYVRYSLLRFGPVNLFTDAAFTYMKPKNGDGTWELGLYPGVAAPLGNKVSAVAHIGCVAYNSDTTFGIGVGNVASAGLYYHF